MSDDPQMGHDEDGAQWPFGPGGFDPSGLGLGGLDLGGLDLNQMFRMLQSPGPVNWEVARQFAESVCRADPDDDDELRDDPPVDPARASALTDLVRAAQTNVAATTGLAEIVAVPVRVVTRVEWTEVTLEGLKPVLEALATRLESKFGPPNMGSGTHPSQNPLAAAAENPDMLAGMMGAIAPLLFGIQAGSLAGLLAQHALGQFDLPLPLAAPPQLAFVLANIDAFASDWSLPPNDLGFALALREVVHAAQRSVPWVRERLVRLASDYVNGYEMRPEILEEQLPGVFDSLEDFDPATLPEALQSGNLPALDIDPSELLAGMRTPAQEPILADLQRFGAVLGGYADAVVDMIGERFVPDAARINEALRRHRVEHGEAGHFVDSMLGLQLDREHYERGHAFCQGVIERAGIDGLNRVWERETMLPTPSEFDAPGLWLARIELDL